MRRVLIPALASVLLTVAACGAAMETEPTVAPSPAAQAYDGELETVTITVLGMG